MGARGPVPKRSTARRRRNKESQPDRVKPVVATVPIPPANPRWHEIAREWYESHAQSGQSQFFEPSDWQAARFWAEVMSRALRSKQRISAQLVAAIASGMNDLLTTEASRRRVRMEIEREPAAMAPASVTSLADFRKSLGA